MQSVRQYRRLGRRLRQQYATVRNKSTRSLGNSNEPTMSSPIDTEKLETRDLENANDARSPVPTDELENTDRVTTQPSRSVLDSPSSTASPLDSAITLAKSFSGVDLRERLIQGDQKLTLYIVGLGDDDNEMDPRNWDLSLKIWATFLIYFHGSIVGIASSIDSAVLNRDRPGFDSSEITESLTTGLFLVAFGFGALFAGPLSEVYGRNPVFILSWTFYMIFIAASSVSPNVSFRLCFRFLAGFFGSAPLTCGGVSIADLWSPTERMHTFPVFANAAIMGPILGPVFGGYIGSNTNNSWRWTEYTDLAAAALLLGLILLFQRETFTPIFLQWKARHLRAITGDGRYRTEVGLSKKPFLPWLKLTVCRPFQITAKEPILILLTLWLTLIWVLMFTFLSGYKYIFGHMGHIHETSEAETGLCFVGIALGLLISSATVPLVAMRLKRDQHQAHQRGHGGLQPESRLWYGLLSAPMIPVALFWMGWTVTPSISIWSPLAASVLLGYGMLGVFTSSYEYIIHAYGTFSGPALSFNTFTRYVVAGIMVEVAPTMWENLGVKWTLTTLGCISAALVPVLYIFFWWGQRIRARSQYAVS